LQWHAARFAPDVIGLITDGERPARVPDAVIDELKGREGHGLVVLPEKPRLDPRSGFQVNDCLRVQAGPLRGLFGLYAGMAPRDRIKVLMDILGGKQEVEMPVGDVSRV
jgi:transcription antitermination factor NusG